MKKAVVCTSFGTLSRDAAEKVLGPLEAELCEKHPGCDIFRAFTSERMVSMMRERGIKAETAETVLERLADNGYRDVLVQSTNIIHGTEYEKLLCSVVKSKDRFEDTYITRPLLYSGKDLERVGAFFAERFSVHSDCILLVGHGSAGEADGIYGKLYDTVVRLGYDNVFVTTLADKAVCDVLQKIKERHCCSVLLAPLLFSAGAHALRDIAGDESGSVRSRLENCGYSVSARICGMGEYPELRGMLTESSRIVRI